MSKNIILLLKGNPFQIYHLVHGVKNLKALEPEKSGAESQTSLLMLCAALSKSVRLGVFTSLYLNSYEGFNTIEYKNQGNWHMGDSQEMMLAKIAIEIIITDDNDHDYYQYIYL